MANTDTRRIVDALITQTTGSSLDEWLRSQRDEGLSWERIARALRETTEGAVEVSWSTVQRWAEAESAA